MSDAQLRAAGDPVLARAVFEGEELALAQLYTRHGGPCLAKKGVQVRRPVVHHQQSESTLPIEPRPRPGGLDADPGPVQPAMSVLLTVFFHLSTSFGVAASLPDRPTAVEHRHPLDDLRRPYDRKTADPISKLHAYTLVAGEHQTHDYYMHVGPFFTDPVARQLYAETHQELDRLLLRLVLEYTGGNQHQAARLLGIARQTLRQKLRDLGLHVTHSVEADKDSPS